MPAHQVDKLATVLRLHFELDDDHYLAHRRSFLVMLRWPVSRTSRRFRGDFRWNQHKISGVESFPQPDAAPFPQESCPEPAPAAQPGGSAPARAPQKAMSARDFLTRLWILVASVTATFTSIPSSAS
jgi:hypothetical protein